MYALAVLFFLSLIAYVSFYLYASTIDAHQYAFNETWYNNAALNFKNLNGRWAQGFTNDHRFYIYRVPTTILLNVFFFSSIWYFFSGLFKKWGFVLASLFYFALVLNSFNFYQIAYLLNTALSYTLGEGLLFLFYGYVIRKGFPLELKKLSTWFFLVTTVFLTGLVEHLFFLNIGILGFLLVFHFLENNKINKGILVYLLVSVVGAAVTVFSPGLQKRRVATALRNQRLGRDSSLDFDAFFQTVQKHIELNLNWVTLLFFLFAFVLFLNTKSLRFHIHKLKPLQFALVILTVLITPFVPILLGYVGSNGLVGMPKAYNLFSFLVLLSAVFLSFLLAQILLRKVEVNTGLINRITSLLALGLFIGIVYSFFYNTKNALYFQQRQVISGDIQKPYFDELARRQYLMETYHHYTEKTIPALSISYKGKVNGAHRSFLPRYYNKRFNSYIPIHSSVKLVTPRSFTTMFLIENKKLQPLYDSNGIKIYYNNTLKTLVFVLEKEVSQTKELSKVTIPVNGTHLLNKKERKLVIHAEQIRKKHPEFFNKYSNYLPVELPLYTERISLPEFQFTIDKDNPVIEDKINFNPDYGNIMR